MVFMVLLGTTGSIIVVWREADAWLNPALFAPATAETLVGADRAFAITATTDPGPVTTLLLPDDIWPVYIAFQSRLVDGKPVIYSVHIDPSNGRVLGARVFFAATVSQIYFLHADLLLRPFGGATVIGIVGIVLLVSASSGLYLWWPKAGWFWRSVTFRWRAATPRLLLDLHNSIGFWTSLVLLVIALSGIELIFPKAFRAVVSVVSPTTGFKAPAAPKHDGPPTIDADAALSIAVARHPDLRPSAISTTGTGTWQVNLLPNVPGNSRGLVNALTWIDATTGAILRDQAPDTMSGGDLFIRAQLGLHNGRQLGLAGRILIFLSGLALAGLGITGIWLWIHKTLARRRTDRRRQATMVLTDETAAR